MTTPAASNALGVNVFMAPGKTMAGERPKPFGEALGFDPITSTLIFGEYDAMLVDAMGTVAEAEALADWLATWCRTSATCTSATLPPRVGRTGCGAGPGWQRCKPAIVVAGHKKPGAPGSPSAVQDT